MLLTFEKQDGTAVSLGPYKAVRFVGRDLHAIETGQRIARHEQDHWQVHGEDYLRVDCEGPVTISFSDGLGNASRQFGPYAHFSLVDGLAYRDHEVFCTLNEKTNRWYVAIERREWAVLVVEEGSS